MKKTLNRVTRFLFGVDCYPDNSNSILEITPTFRTVFPEGYDPSDCARFNAWSEGIFSSLKTK